MLSKSNYAAWAIKVKVYMRAQGVWDAVEPGTTDTRLDQMALAAIYQGIPDDTLFLLAEKTAKEAWEALKSMHIGADRVKEARAQTLKSAFEGLRMKETESVDDFAVRLTTLVNQIRGLGVKMEESYVVQKLLRAVPNKYLQIVSTIEQFGDMKTMMVDEAIGRLKAYEDRLCIMSGDNDDEHLLLTSAEWKVRSAKKQDGESDGSDSNGGRSRGNRKFDKAKVRCYNCNDYGHFASECRKKKEEAHLAEIDYEPALL